MAKVRITQGTLVGKKSKTSDGFEYNEFIQIPYAKPPLGQLRFKSPQPPEKWGGEKDVSQTNDKLIAVQCNPLGRDVKNLQSIQTIGSEDCLYLNVYTPVLPTTTTTLLPVMVYIHGGGFINGNGTIKSFCSPDYFINKGVVVVTINYRLGIFGFLSLDIPEAAGNMGLKDQVMALKWIQNNISNFGGDKNNVTLFGISAGAASIEYLLLSPSTRGLYHKCILQSGSSLNHWAIKYNIKDLAVKVAQELRYPGLSNDFRGIYEFLMERTTDEISVAFKMSDFVNMKGFDFGFVPSIEKDFGNGEEFLTEYPYNLLKEGRFNKVPIIRGFCESEGLLTAVIRGDDFKEVLNKKTFINVWKYPINPSDVVKYDAKFTEAYLNNKSYDDDEQFAVDFFGDWDFASGICISNELIAEQKVPVYAYMFKYDGGLNMVKLTFNIKKKGVCHGDDMAYTVNIELPEVMKPSETDLIIVKRISKLWTDFAKFGNPTPTTSDLIPITWTVFNNRDKNYLIIDKELEIKTPYDIKKIEVFEEIYEEYRK